MCASGLISSGIFVSMCVCNCLCIGEPECGAVRECHFAANWNRIESPFYLKNKVKRKFGDLVTSFAGFRYWY